MSIYNMRSTAKGLRCVKFDDLLNVEAVYELTEGRGRYNCPCFQHAKPSCRHREMVPEFIARKAVNSGRFYDYDEKRWHPAVKGG